ncbi:MAG: porphobilinogen synthase [Acidobacteria bacterium]|nr:porphobilinogen synthase [Acidobacteriota bacterium]
MSDVERLMRLRRTQQIRDLCDEVEFTTSHLIQPLFVADGLDGEQPITGLAGNKRMDVFSAVRQVGSDIENGVRHFILFPIPSDKGKKNFNHAFTSRVISSLRKAHGKAFTLWVDTCLCSYTEHGHCCVFGDGEQIDLDSTLGELSRSAVAFAEAGADGVSPSDMMDGRTGAIRQALDDAGHGMIPIMSYSTKFASSFYGPFREAADSAPQFGDRKSYQIDPRNRSDAIRSSVRCAEEGADLLMVKPGMTSIDLIMPIRELTDRPVGAYQVSGEYAGLALLAEKGLTDLDRALLETWHVFRRAGAQYIITYGARRAARIGLKVH